MRKILFPALAIVATLACSKSEPMIHPADCDYGSTELGWDEALFDGDSADTRIEPFAGIFAAEGTWSGDEVTTIELTVVPSSALPVIHEPLEGSDGACGISASLPVDVIVETDDGAISAVAETTWTVEPGEEASLFSVSVQLDPADVDYDFSDDLADGEEAVELSLALAVSDDGTLTGSGVLLIAGSDADSDWDADIMVLTF